MVTPMHSDWYNSSVEGARLTRKILSKIVLEPEFPEHRVGSRRKYSIELEL